MRKDSSAEANMGFPDSHWTYQDVLDYLRGLHALQKTVWLPMVSENFGWDVMRARENLARMETAGLVVYSDLRGFQASGDGIQAHSRNLSPAPTSWSQSGYAIVSDGLNAPLFHCFVLSESEAAREVSRASGFPEHLRRNLRSVPVTVPFEWACAGPFDSGSVAPATPYQRRTRCDRCVVTGQKLRKHEGEFLCDPCHAQAQEEAGKAESGNPPGEDTGAPDRVFSDETVRLATALVWNHICAKSCGLLSPSWDELSDERRLAMVDVTRKLADEATPGSRPTVGSPAKIPQAGKAEQVRIEMAVLGDFRNGATVAIEDVDGGYRSPSVVTQTFDPEFMPIKHGDCSSRVGNWPPFMLDLLPQSGRKHIAAVYGLDPDVDAPVSQYEFLLASGSSPIGNLRVAESLGCGWPRKGWTFDELFRLDEDKSLPEELALHAPGAFGVQGAWPKFLVTQSSDGLWYPDHAVKDSNARSHGILKWCADDTEVNRAILSSEAPYVELARALGLDAGQPLVHRRNVLFIPRFDRHVQSGRVFRYGQRSIAAASGRTDFGVYGTHETYLKAITRLVRNPQRAIAEYLARDVFNQATGNTDNHGRNTAFLRRADGVVHLSPVYDVCPQGLADPDERRATVWASEDDGHLRTDWKEVAARAAALTTSIMRSTVEDHYRTYLKGLRPFIQSMPDMARNGNLLPRMVLDVISENCARLAEDLKNDLG